MNRPLTYISLDIGDNYRQDYLIYPVVYKKYKFNIRITIAIGVGITQTIGPAAVIIDTTYIIGLLVDIIDIRIIGRIVDTDAI